MSNKTGEPMSAALRITDPISPSPMHKEHVRQFEKDRRAMNHMDPETKLVHARLEEWAVWSRDHMLEGDGWPSTTPMGRTVEEGIHGAGQQTRAPISMPPRVEQVDKAVAKLGEIDRKVIHTYYRRWQPREVLARTCNMRLREFDNVLKRARWRIMGFLSAQSI